MTSMEEVRNMQEWEQTPEKIRRKSSIQFHAPVLKCGCLIRMRSLKRSNHVADFPLRTDHLQFPFRDIFLASACPEKWLSPLQGAELSAPADLKTAAIVIADSPCTGAEHRLFHRSGMSLRHININSSVFHHVKTSFCKEKCAFHEEIYAESAFLTVRKLTESIICGKLPHGKTKQGDKP